MKVGDVVKATIVNIKDFGAFADFDGGYGLIYFTIFPPQIAMGGAIVCDIPCKNGASYTRVMCK